MAALALLAGVSAGCGEDGSTTSADAADTTEATTTAAGPETSGDAGTGAEAGVVVPEPDPDPGEVELYFTSGEQFEPVERAGRRRAATRSRR